MSEVIYRERRRGRRRSRLWGRVPRVWRIPLLLGFVLLTMLVLSAVHGSRAFPRISEPPPELEAPR